MAGVNSILSPMQPVPGTHFSSRLLPAHPALAAYGKAGGANSPQRVLASSAVTAATLTNSRICGCAPAPCSCDAMDLSASRASSQGIIHGIADISSVAAAVSSGMTPLMASRCAIDDDRRITGRGAYTPLVLSALSSPRSSTTSGKGDATVPTFDAVGEAGGMSALLSRSLAYMTASPSITGAAAAGPSGAASINALVLPASAARIPAGSASLQASPGGHAPICPPTPQRTPNAYAPRRRRPAGALSASRASSTEDATDATQVVGIAGTRRRRDSQSDAGTQQVGASPSLRSQIAAAQHATTRSWREVLDESLYTAALQAAPINSAEDDLSRSCTLFEFTDSAPPTMRAADVSSVLDDPDATAQASPAKRAHWGRRLNLSGDVLSTSSGDASRVSEMGNNVSSSVVFRAAPGRSSIQFDTDFRVSRILGHGSFSIVYDVVDVRDGRHYAVKRSQKRMRSRRDRERLLREFITFAHTGQHPNLISYQRVWQENGFLFFQMDLCPGGSFRDIIAALPPGRAVPEHTVWTFIAHVAAALQHLHSHGHVHLDVKPENVFVDGTILRLGDLGMSTCVHSDGHNHSHGVRHPGGDAHVDGGMLLGPTLDSSFHSTGSGPSGSAMSDDDDLEGDSRYLASELLSSGASARAAPADILSLGVSAWELAWDASPPGDGDAWHALREQRVPAPAASLGRTSELVSLVLAMLHPTPSMRPTAAHILSHPLVMNAAARSDPLLVCYERGAEALRSAASGSAAVMADTTPRLVPTVQLTTNGLSCLQLLPGGGNLHASVTQQHPGGVSAPPAIGEDYELRGPTRGAALGRSHSYTNEMTLSQEMGLDGGVPDVARRRQGSAASAVLLEGIVEEASRVGGLDESHDQHADVSMSSSDATGRVPAGASTNSLMAWTGEGALSPLLHAPRALRTQGMLGQERAQSVSPTTAAGEEEHVLHAPLKSLRRGAGSRYRGAGGSDVSAESVSGALSSAATSEVEAFPIEGARAAPVRVSLFSISAPSSRPESAVSGELAAVQLFAGTRDAHATLSRGRSDTGSSSTSLILGHAVARALMTEDDVGTSPALITTRRSATPRSVVAPTDPRASVLAGRQNGNAATLMDAARTFSSPQELLSTARRNGGLFDAPGAEAEAAEVRAQLMGAGGPAAATVRKPNARRRTVRAPRRPTLRTRRSSVPDARAEGPAAPNEPNPAAPPQLHPRDAAGMLARRALGTFVDGLAGDAQRVQVAFAAAASPQGAFGASSLFSPALPGIFGGVAVKARLAATFDDAVSPVTRGSDEDMDESGEGKQHGSAMVLPSDSLSARLTQRHRALTHASLVALGAVPPSAALDDASTTSTGKRTHCGIVARGMATDRVARAIQFEGADDAARSAADAALPPPFAPSSTVMLRARLGAVMHAAALCSDGSSAVVPEPASLPSSKGLEGAFTSSFGRSLCAAAYTTSTTTTTSAMGQRVYASAGLDTMGALSATVPELTPLREPGVRRSRPPSLASEDDLGSSADADGARGRVVYHPAARRRVDMDASMSSQGSHVSMDEDDDAAAMLLQEELAPRTPPPRRGSTGSPVISSANSAFARALRSHALPATTAKPPHAPAHAPPGAPAHPPPAPRRRAIAAAAAARAIGLQGAADPDGWSDSEDERPRASGSGQRRPRIPREDVDTDRVRSPAAKRLNNNASPVLGLAPAATVSAVSSLPQLSIYMDNARSSLPAAAADAWTVCVMTTDRSEDGDDRASPVARAQGDGDLPPALSIHTRMPVRRAATGGLHAPLRGGMAAIDETNVCADDEAELEDALLASTMRAATSAGSEDNAFGPTHSLRGGVHGTSTVGAGHVLSQHLGLHIGVPHVSMLHSIAATPITPSDDVHTPANQMINIDSRHWVAK